MNGDALPLRDSTITLHDGRKLAFAEYGVPAGRPVIFFNGTPGGRLLHPRTIMAGASNTRIISIDRPGYGYSDFSPEVGPEGGMLEWAADVAELATALGIERFAVVGPSGGAPYAAACAYRLSDRVTAAGLISCAAPFPVDRHPGGRSAATATLEGLGETVVVARSMSLTDFVSWFTEHRGSTPPSFEQVLAMMKDQLPEYDRQLLELPEVEQNFRLSLTEAFRQGMHGWARDAWVLTRPWGFQPEDIRVPVYLWHGESDQVVPVEDGRYLSQIIPNCRATFYPHTGHIIPSRPWEDILAALAA